MILCTPISISLNKICIPTYLCNQSEIQSIFEKIRVDIRIYVSLREIKARPRRFPAIMIQYYAVNSPNFPGFSRQTRKSAKLIETVFPRVFFSIQPDRVIRITIKLLLEVL